MHTVRVRSGLTLLAILVLSTAAAAQGVITIQGTVKGRQDDAKQFASVSLEGPGHYVAITDANGAFTIERVILGKYTVRVRQGDRIAEMTSDVNSGRLVLAVNW